MFLASVVGLVGFGWPFLTGATSTLAGHSADSPYLFLLLLPLVVGVVLAELSEGGMDAKAVAMLGVLAAAGTALRALSPGTGGLEPTLFLVVVAGRVFGAGFGYALGTTVILASSLVTAGVGPWMPFQMVGLAWVGLLAGLLPVVTGRAERVLLAVYAGVAGFGYGALLNLSFWPFSRSLPEAMAYVPGDSTAANLRHYAAFYVTTSFGWDCVRALVNAVLVLVAGRVVLATLRRAARRAAFAATTSFDAPTTSRGAPRLREPSPEEDAGDPERHGGAGPQVTGRPDTTSWTSP
nr:ECF transporter S component [Actinopolymorpha pittospori]